jgi:amino acid permease
MVYLVQPPVGHSIGHWPGILQSVGIFAVSVSGHSSLPVLRTSMRQPRVRYPHDIQMSPSMPL